MVGQWGVNPNATPMQPQWNPDATPMQPQWNPDATLMQPQCYPHGMGKPSQSHRHGFPNNDLQAKAKIGYGVDILRQLGGYRLNIQ